MAKRWRRWTVLVAVLAGLLAAVACGTGGDSDDSARNGGNGSGTAAPGEDALAEPSSGGDGAEEAAGDQDDAAGSSSGGSTGETLAFQDGARKVIFRSQLELTSENVEATYREITNMARQVGGYVSDAQVQTSSEEDGDQRASVTVRVPSERREGLIEDIRTLTGVTVQSEQTRAEEVTEEYTDLESRLRNLERSEARYLELLDEAEDVSEILEVQDRIDRVRSEIEQIQGRLNVLDDLVDFSTLSVSIAPVDESEGEDEDEGPPSFIDAWNSAWSWLGDAGLVGAAALGWASAVAIILLPVLAIAAGIRFAARRGPTGGA